MTEASQTYTGYAKQDSLGWGTKLEAAADGAYKAWAGLWREGKYNEFADASFYGASFEFVRYDADTHERMLVRHYRETEWKTRILKSGARLMPRLPNRVGGPG